MNVFISGASSDIGFALCRKYLNAGHQVIGHARSEGDEYSQLIKDELRFEGVFADFTDSDGRDEMLRAVRDKWQAIDIFVHAAALVSRAPFLELTEEAIVRSLLPFKA